MTSTTPRPGGIRAHKAQEMRTRLLDATESLYASEGSRALTNRRIATEADTTTQSIYTYYGSREALVDAMYQRAVAGVDDILDAAVALAAADRTDEAIFDVFKDVAKSYRKYCHDHPARFRMIRVADHDPEAPPPAQALRERLIGALVEFGRSGGTWDEPYYESRSRLTVAAVHGFILAELESFITEVDDPDRLFDELVHRCLVRWEELPGL